MDGDEIRAAEKLVLARILCPRFAAFLRCEILAPRQHLHSERLRNAGSAGAELAQPENPERQSFEVKPDGALPGYAGLHARILVSDAPAELQHPPDGNAARRTADCRRAAHHDAALPRGRNIDGSIARAGRDQELEMRQLLDHRAGKARALPHGADDLKPLQRLDDPVLGSEMRVENLDVEVACAPR